MRGRCLFRRSRPITEMFSPHKTKRARAARAAGSVDGNGLPPPPPPPPPSIGRHAEERRGERKGGMSERARRQCSWRAKEPALPPSSLLFPSSPQYGNMWQQTAAFLPSLHDHASPLLDSFFGGGHDGGGGRAHPAPVCGGGGGGHRNESAHRPTDPPTERASGRPPLRKVPHSLAARPF